MDNSVSVSEGLICLDSGLQRVRRSLYQLVGDSRFSRDKLKTDLLPAATSHNRA
jgi:hypothetical protein